MIVRGKVISRRASRRRGAALVEAALSLSLLAFLFLVVIDYCRIFYCTVILENAACAGAQYASRDATHLADTAGIQAAAQADTGDLSPAPTAATTTGTDANGDATVTVTVTYTFKTIANYAGIPSQANIIGQVTMRQRP